MRLDPSSEKLPDGGVCKREAQKAHTDHQNAAQRCGTMQFVRGPQIIECQQKQEAVGSKQGWENPLIEEEDVKAGERGPKKRDGRDQDEAFVGGRIFAGAIRKKYKNREHDHFAERNDVEGFGVDPRRSDIAHQQIRAGKQAEDHHKAGKGEAEQTDAAMDVDAMSGDKTSLENQEKNPARKYGTVEMNQGTWKMGPEHSSQKVSGSEANEHRDEDQDRCD